jgi:hypothetical protein
MPSEGGEMTGLLMNKVEAFVCSSSFAWFLIGWGLGMLIGIVGF